MVIVADMVFDRCGDFCREFGLGRGRIFGVGASSRNETFTERKTRSKVRDLSSLSS